MNGSNNRLHFHAHPFSHRPIFVHSADLFKIANLLDVRQKISWISVCHVRFNAKHGQVSITLKLKSERMKNHRTHHRRQCSIFTIYSRFLAFIPTLLTINAECHYYIGDVDNYIIQFHLNSTLFIADGLSVHCEWPTTMLPSYQIHSRFFTFWSTKLLGQH